MEKLQSKLQYKFQDLTLLKTAITHRSMGANNNQRLEFLGDAVLQLIITDALFVKFPKAVEGILTRLRATLVCGDTLAQLATELQLSEHLILSSAERKSNGQHRSSTLTDVLEAIMGAVYLDSDLEVCRTWMLKLYQARLDAMDTPVITKDPKTLLQELLQSKKQALPVYRVIVSAGVEHDKIFHVTAGISLLPNVVEGKDTSIRGAEQDAARKILELLNPHLVTTSLCPPSPSLGRGKSKEHGKI